MGDGSYPRLAGIERIVPVLASSYFSPEMMELCLLKNVGIVKPNGRGHSYIPSTSSPSKPTPARRVLHVGLVSRLCCW